jgi:hypothetical protein
MPALQHLAAGYEERLTQLTWRLVDTESLKNVRFRAGFDVFSELQVNCSSQDAAYYAFSKNAMHHTAARLSHHVELSYVETGTVNCESGTLDSNSVPLASRPQQFHSRRFVQQCNHRFRIFGVWPADRKQTYGRITCSYRAEGRQRHSSSITTAINWPFL